MARDLRQNDRNSLKINDAISGGEIELFYRMPTTAERIGFQKECVKREGKKIRTRVPETRFKYGSTICTGFRKGDFTDGDDVISSDPSDPEYRKSWKVLLEETAGDLLMELGRLVFEGAAKEAAEGLEFSDDDDAPELPEKPEGTGGEDEEGDGTPL